MKETIARLSWQEKNELATQRMQELCKLKCQPDANGKHPGSHCTAVSVGRARTIGSKKIHQAHLERDRLATTHLAGSLMISTLEDVTGPPQKTVEAFRKALGERETTLLKEHRKKKMDPKEQLQLLVTADGTQKARRLHAKSVARMLDACGFVALSANALESQLSELKNTLPSRSTLPKGHGRFVHYKDYMDCLTLHPVHSRLLDLRKPWIELVCEDSFSEDQAMQRSDTLLSTSTLSWGEGRTNSHNYRLMLGVWRNATNASSGQENHDIAKANIAMALEPMLSHVKDGKMEMLVPADHPKQLLPGGDPNCQMNTKDQFKFDNRDHHVVTTDHRALNTIGKAFCNRPGHRSCCRCHLSSSAAKSAPLKVSVPFKFLSMFDCVGAAAMMEHTTQRGHDGGMGLWIDRLCPELSRQMDGMTWKEWREDPEKCKKRLSIPDSCFRRMTKEIKRGEVFEQAAKETEEKCARRAKRVQDSTIRSAISDLVHKLNTGGRRGVPVMSKFVDDHRQVIPCSLHGGKINSASTLFFVFLKCAPNEEFKKGLRDVGHHSLRRIWNVALGSHKDDKKRKKKKGDKEFPTTTGEQCNNFVLDLFKHSDKCDFDKASCTKLALMGLHFTRAMFTMWSRMKDEDYEDAIDRLEIDCEIFAQLLIELDHDSYGGHIYPQMIRCLFPRSARWLWQKHGLKMAMLSMQASESCNSVVKRLVRTHSNNQLLVKCLGADNLFGQVMLADVFSKMHNATNMLDCCEIRQRCSQCGETGHNKRNKKECRMHPERRASYLHIFDAVDPSKLDASVIDKFCGQSTWNDVLKVDLWKKH